MSISLDEILKKVRSHKKIFLYHPKKSELLKVFKSKIKVIIASGGIVSNEKSKILFIYRRGKWDLPKGKAEKGETIRETAIREVMEETGIEHLKIDKYFSNTFHIVRNKKKYFLKQVISRHSCEENGSGLYTTSWWYGSSKRDEYRPLFFKNYNILFTIWKH